MFLTEYYSIDQIKKVHTVGSYGTYEKEEGIQNFGKMSNSYTTFLGREDVIRKN
jgi:hypothetical protein